MNNKLESSEEIHIDDNTCKENYVKMKHERWDVPLRYLPSKDEQDR